MFGEALLSPINQEYSNYRKEFVGFLDYNVDDCDEAMKSLKIMSIYDRLYLRKAISMFKVYNNEAPRYISENFTLRDNINTSINLRSISSGCFIPPKPRTEFFKHSMRYSGCLIWNSLPDEVKMLRLLPPFITDVYNG